MSPSLKAKTVHGAIWMVVGTGGQQLTAFIVMMVLARLLGPQAYGVVGIASVLIEILGQVSRAGLVEILIQRSEVSDDELDTAFWTTLTFGAILTIVLFFAAPFVADFYHEPELTSATQYLSAFCFLYGAGAVQEAILRREFGFKALALRNLGGLIFSSIIAVIMAYQGFGVMALVVQRLLVVLYQTVVLWFSVKWRPRFVYSLSLAKSQLRDGFVVTASSVLGSGNQRIIDLIVGYFLGTVALGYLRIAWRGLDLLLEVGIRPVMSVAFSSFAELQKDKQGLERAYNRIIQITAVISIPMFIGVIPVSYEVITALFGAKWENSVPLLQILSLTGFFVPLTYFKTNLLFAIGHMKEVMKVNFIEFVISVLTAIVFCQISLEGAAIGNVVRVCLATPVILYYVGKCSGIRPASTLRMVVPAAVSSIIMAAVLWGLRDTVFAGLHGLGRALVMVVLGALLYPAILFVGFKRDFMEVAETLLPFLPKRFSRAAPR